VLSLYHCALGAVLYLKRVVSTVRLSKFGMVYYNNLLSMPLLLGLAILIGELGDVWAQVATAVGGGGDTAAPQWVTSPVAFVGTMIVSGAVGFALNGASLWCVQATSPSTFSMVGALNKIPLAVSGGLSLLGRSAFVMKACVHAGFVLVGLAPRGMWHVFGGCFCPPARHRHGGRGVLGVGVGVGVGVWVWVWL
jgi:hypothetical protein